MVKLNRKQIRKIDMRSLRVRNHIHSSDAEYKIPGTNEVNKFNRFSSHIGKHPWVPSEYAFQLLQKLYLHRIPFEEKT